MESWNPSVSSLVLDVIAFGGVERNGKAEPEDAERGEPLDRQTRRIAQFIKGEIVSDGRDVVLAHEIDVLVGKTLPMSKKALNLARVTPFFGHWHQQFETGRPA